MQSGTQPGHHAGQKAAGLGAALAHGARGGFLRRLGLLSGTVHRFGRGQGKTPMRSGAQRAIMPGKEKSPGMAGESFL